MWSQLLDVNVSSQNIVFQTLAMYCSMLRIFTDINQRVNICFFFVGDKKGILCFLSYELHCLISNNNISLLMTRQSQIVILIKHMYFPQTHWSLRWCIFIWLLYYDILNVTINFEGNVFFCTLYKLSSVKERCSRRDVLFCIPTQQEEETSAESCLCPTLKSFLQIMSYLIDDFINVIKYIYSNIQKPWLMPWYSLWYLWQYHGTSGHFQKEVFGIVFTH